MPVQSRVKPVSNRKAARSTASKGLQRPWVSLVLLSLIVLIAWWNTHLLDDRGAAGPGVIGTIMKWSPENSGAMRYDKYAIRGGGDAVRLIDPESESMGEVSTLWEEHPERVMTVSIEVAVGRTPHLHKIGLADEDRHHQETQRSQDHPAAGRQWRPVALFGIGA